MHSLRSALERAASGCGQLRMLIGEPGIGKTRTAEELAAYARARGAHVLWGRCSENDGAPAFWPWVQIIRAATRGLDADALCRALGPGAPDIAQLVPQVRERLPDLPAPSGLDSSEARFRLFDSVARFLEHLAHQAPLVLIIDDLHGADQPSLLLLQFVARELRDLPMLVVTARRDVALTRAHPLTETVAEVLRESGAERLLLRGLSQPEVAHLFELTAGIRPPAALVATIHKHTEGNPLFVAEYARLLRSEHEQCAIGSPHSATALPVPQGVKAVIGQRLAPLSPECNDLISVAAVIGREFHHDVLETAAGGNRATADLLAEAVAAGVLTEVPTGAGRYRFAHALIRETSYEELSAPRRMRLHRQVGEAIEQTVGVENHLAELAYHFFEAGRDGDNEKAVTYARRAGDRALALLAYEEAARLYQMGLDALERHRAVRGESPTAARLRGELLVALARAHSRAGNVADAKETALRAIEVARPLDARELLSDAVLILAGRSAWGQGLTVDETLASLLEEAVTAWGEDDSAVHAQLIARLAVALYFTPAAVRRNALSERAVAMARRVGEPAALVDALATQHVAIWGPDTLEQRLAIAHEMVALTKHPRNLEMAIHGHLLRFADCLELGDGEAANAAVEACSRLAEESRQPLYAWYCSRPQFARAIMHGRFAEAEEIARRALAIGRDVNTGATVAFSVMMFFLRHLQGRLAEVEGIVSAAADQSAHLPAFRCMRVFAYAQLNRETAARREFELVTANGCRDVPRDITWLSAISLIAEVCWMLADGACAATLYELLVPYATRCVTVTEVSYWGTVAYQLGLLATTLSRWEDATRHFDAALATDTRMRAWPFVARDQYAHADMLVRRYGWVESGRRTGESPVEAAVHGSQDWEKALLLLDQAVATARELGMRGLEQKAQTLKDSVQPVSDQHEPRGWSEAHPRLPAEGLRDAAQAVFRHEGDFWTIAYGGTALRLKDGRGVQYLAQLIRHPGHRLSALDLVSGSVGSDQHTEARNYGSRAEHLLDAKAKGAYKRRLDDLREELEEAERFNDLGRAARAREEMDIISQELAAAIGLGGRGRLSPWPAERARQAVTKGIKSVITKIRAGNPALAHHLTTTVATGYFCLYLPDPDTIISWLF